MTSTPPTQSVLLTSKVQFSGGCQVGQTPDIGASSQHKLMGTVLIARDFHFQITAKKQHIHQADPDLSWSFRVRSSPVVFLLVEVGHKFQQAADEGVCTRLAGRGLAGSLRGEHGAAPLGVGQLLLHLHVLLPQQGQVLLQLPHLLCAGRNKSIHRVKYGGFTKVCSKHGFKVDCVRQPEPKSKEEDLRTSKPGPQLTTILGPDLIDYSRKQNNWVKEQRHVALFKISLSFFFFISKKL